MILDPDHQGSFFATRSCTYKNLCLSSFRDSTWSRQDLLDRLETGALDVIFKLLSQRFQAIRDAVQQVVHSLEI